MSFVQPMVHSGEIPESLKQHGSLGHALPNMTHQNHKIKIWWTPMLLWGTIISSWYN
jgi:hypothetical protein